MCLLLVVEVVVVVVVVAVVVVVVVVVVVLCGVCYRFTNLPFNNSNWEWASECLACLNHAVVCFKLKL